MNILVRTILLFAALLSAPFARALGLGDITGNGALGQRLDARVPLYLAPGERATLTGAEILPDMFARNDSTPLDGLRASIVADGSQTYVRVSSRDPIAVEHLRFRLRVNSARGAVIARYALRAMPVSRSTVRTSTVSPAARSIVPRSSSLVAAPGVAPDHASRYGPVRRGESLWTIAQRLTSAGDVTSTMQRLHAANPSAFIGGDMNRLRAGVTLVLPADLASQIPVASTTASTSSRVTNPIASDDELGAGTFGVDDGESASAVTATMPDAMDGASSGLDTLLGDARGESTDIVAPSSPANITSDSQVPRAGTSDGASDAAVGTGARDDALTAQLAALDAKFAAIRARYGEASASTAMYAAAPANPDRADTATAQAPVTPQQSPVSASDAPMAAVPEVAAQSPPASRSAAAVAAPDTGSAARTSWLPLAGLPLLLAILLLAVGPRLRGRLVASRTRARAASVKADDAGLKAEVARKAENRVRLESEIQGLLKRKSTGAAIAAAPMPAIAPAPLAETTHPPVSPFEQTLDPLAITSGGTLLENDREVAIDANIAHGRYAEAEVLLREVIQTNPRNVQAKLRLAEVYYITEKLDGFASVATDIKDHHRGDLTDDEWQRVVRMGKIIAPDLALFSGPKAVGRRA